MSRPRWRAWLLGVTALALVLYAAQRPIMSGLGRALILDQPLERAEAAIMTSDAEKTGPLELADLLAEGVVPRVAVVVPAPSPVDAELTRRGVPTFTSASLVLALGVPADRLSVIATDDGGTTDASTAIVRWCEKEHITSIVIVTSATHGRRVHRAILRVPGAKALTVRMRQARSDGFRADNWWQQRGPLRAGIVELEKLFLDFAAHPFG